MNRDKLKGDNMKAKVNQDGCIGCGACEQLCPKVFRLNENGVAEVYEEVTPDVEALTKEAADTCPVSVIEVEV